MASSYFYREGYAPDYDLLTMMLDPISLNSARSLDFSQRGTHYIRVDKPLIGDVYSILSDARIENDGDTSVIRNETQINSVRLIQLFFGTGGYYAEFENSSSQRVLDNTLGIYNPGGDNMSYMDKLTVNPGQAGGSFTPFFFLVINGGAIGGGSGRALVVEGDATGVREQSWGDWLDGSPSGPGEDPGGEQPEEPVNDDTLHDAQDLLADIQAEIAFREQISNQLYLELEAARELQALNELRLEGLSDEQLGLIALQTLETLGIAGTWAEAYLSVSRAPTGVFYKSFGDTKTAVELHYALLDASQNPDWQSYAKLHEKNTAYVAKAAEYKGQLGNYLKALQVTKKTEEFYQNTKDNYKDASSVRDNMYVVETEIQRLTALQENLTATLIDNRNTIVELQQTANTIVERSPEATNTYLFGTGHQHTTGGRPLLHEERAAVNSATFVEMVTLTADYQSVLASQGDVMVFGADSRHDRVDIGASFTDFEITTPGGDWGMFENSRLSLITQDVERVSFRDLTIAFDDDGMAGIGYRIYQAAFDRVPDYVGLGHWIRQLDSGVSLLNVAAAFVGSDEFRAVYGTNPTAKAYIAKLYQNVLGREGEADGAAFWEEQLASGVSAAQVLAHFSESPENISGVASSIADGIWYI
ncbi:DUF4214 domain-containing protein [Rhizobium sp. LjRoot30]|uniref:DUF4214 domain-containing protein n=1 Tax=Rhizobium sp. LjRoot30 TaxID=3342320 RepID=UPI003ED08C7D